jgi:hypothetical protein
LQRALALGEPTATSYALPQLGQNTVEVSSEDMTYSLLQIYDYTHSTKFEIRISKSETNPKHESQNLKQGDCFIVALLAMTGTGVVCHCERSEAI